MTESVTNQDVINRAFKTYVKSTETREFGEDNAAFQEFLEACLDAFWALNGGKLPAVIIRGSESTTASPKTSRTEFIFNPTSPAGGQLIGIVNNHVENLNSPSTFLQARYSIAEKGHHIEEWHCGGRENSSPKKEVEDALIDSVFSMPKQ